MARWLRLLPLPLLGACALFGGRAAVDAGAVDAFLARFDAEHSRVYREASLAAWVQATHITEDTQKLAADAYARALEHRQQAAHEARAFDGLTLAPQTRRALDVLRRSASAPTDPELLREYTQLESRLDAMYSSGQWCPDGEASCQRLQALEEVFTSSRDPAALREAWVGWRTVAQPMKAPYQRFVELLNTGAGELGYADAGALWRDYYDMSPEAFRAEADRLWQQIAPLYEQLHCYVRGRLGAHYPGEITPDGPLPAHLLGNMWAQTWGNIYPLVEPYPGVADSDLTAALNEQGYTPRTMVEQAESFYEGLGFPALPESFWADSMMVRPPGREVRCHASAWNMDLDGAVRLKMCTRVNHEDLFTVYHELGHLYYYIAYRDQPYLFQSGAHDGFHEAVGDTMTLAMTPAYLRAQGLLDTVEEDPRALINVQMRTALDKVAFLPFGMLVDQWRWRVFSGETPPQRYTADWWELRLRYQGLVPPVARDDAVDFDPGAKYHIPGNTPYMRYFLAFVLQFQFYEAMCDLSGHQGPLHECSFAGSREAGTRMWNMLALGRSQPWPEVLEQLTGTREMDGQPLLEYFAPLSGWLAEQNAGQACGW